MIVLRLSAIIHELLYTIDENILSDFASGNKTAFEKIYRNYYLAVFRLAKKFITEQQASEDITADTFLKLWEKKSAFAHRKQLESWLFLATRNNCINWLRNKKRHSGADQRLSLLEPVQVENTWEEEEIATLVYRHIYDEINKLPRNMQEIMKGSLEGKKNAEMANELGLNEKTIRNLKTEAVKKIRLSLLVKEFILADLFLLFLLGRPF